MQWIANNQWIWLIIFFMGTPIMIILMKFLLRSIEVGGKKKELKGINVETVRKTVGKIEKLIQTKKKRQLEFQEAHEGYKNLKENFTEKLEEADLETVNKMVKKLKDSKLREEYKEYERLNDEILKLQKKLDDASDSLDISIVNKHTMNPCLGEWI